MVCPKINENDFFAQRIQSTKGKWWSRQVDRGTEVYSLTFLSSVRACVAVGTLAKCIVVLCLVTCENAEESGAASRD